MANATMSSDFESLADKFELYHANTLNVALNLTTTPLALLCGLCLLNRATKSTLASPVLCILYASSLFATIPNGLAGQCVVMLIGLACLSLYCKFDAVTSVVLMAVGYMAHVVTSEETYMSSYDAAGANWSELFFEHVYYLLPLVLTTVAPMLGSTGLLAIALTPALAVCLLHSLHSEGGVFPWAFAPARVLNTKLQTQDDLEDLAAVRSFAVQQNPSHTSSSHWWYQKDYDMAHSLDETGRQSFKRIAGGNQMMQMFYDHFDPKYYTTECVDGMNELYCTGPTISKADSDTVFYTKHIDGPYGMVPFASLYRCIMATDANTQVSTIYPSTGQLITAADGDCIAFDFHREPHYIQSDMSKRNKDLRIVLKLHYVVYPKWAKPVGMLLHYLSVKYNENFRALFLFTIQPKTVFQRITAWNVVFWTVVVEKFWAFIGMSNLVYLLMTAAASVACENHLIFLAATSFVHSLRIMATCYFRSHVDFGVFKRDVVLFKSVAFAQILYYYGHSIELVQPESAGLVGVGCLITAAAAIALGTDRLFYGEELELCQCGHATSNFLKYAVLLGEVVVFLGCHKAASFSTGLPYLMPIHVALNVALMLQLLVGIRASDSAVQPTKILHQQLEHDKLGAPNRSRSARSPSPKPKAA